MAMRSALEKSTALDTLSNTPTYTLSNNRRLRCIRSICPLVTGSNVPGYTATRPIADLFHHTLARESPQRLPPWSRRACHAGVS